MRYTKRQERELIINIIALDENMVKVIVKIKYLQRFN